MFAAPGGAAGSPRLYWNDPQASTSLLYKMQVKKSVHGDKNLL